MDGTQQYNTLRTDGVRMVGGWPVQSKTPDGKWEYERCGAGRSQAVWHSRKGFSLQESKGHGRKPEERPILAHPTCVGVQDPP